MNKMHTHKLDLKTDLPAGGEVKTLDSFGYEVVPPKVDIPIPPPEVKIPEPPKLEDLKDPVTGYGKEPPKVLPPEPPKVDLGYELEVKDLEPGMGQIIKDFAKKNNLTKEVAQAFVELKKSELKSFKDQQIAFQKNQEDLITQTKASWDKELRDHPNFGGDNFSKSVLKVEKILSEHMPETKKILTEKGSMLPPYVMRDFAKLASHLYDSENLKSGDPHVGDTENKETKENNPLDFYS